jgi:hypothetical protein
MKHRHIIGLLLAFLPAALAQTKVDLAKQSKNIDFSQASFVRPFPLGTALPATCQVGQVFFLTTAPASAYECTSTNVWAPIQGSTGAAAGTIDVQFTSSTVLTVGSRCSIPTPCLFRVGSTEYSLLAPVTVTLTSGSGLAMVYIDSNANLTVGVTSLTAPAVACSGCVVVAGITAYPLGTIPVEVWNATNGSWDASGTSNLASLSVAPALVAGDNITLTQAAGTVTIAANAAGSSGGSGSGSGGSGSSGSSFNPMDPTQFYRDHFAIASGYSQGPDAWSYSGNCQAGNVTGLTGFLQETITSANWSQVAGGGNACSFYFPGGASGGAGSFDYWSGSSPAQLWAAATYLISDTNGVHYVGLTNNASTFSDFIGCRQTGSGDWFAVIRAGGNDVATADTGVAHDSLAHRLIVDNNTGAANTVRCSVDGANTAAATGTVPAETFGWTFVFGAVALGSSATNFAPFQYTIFLQGLPRQ